MGEEEWGGESAGVKGRGERPERPQGPSVSTASGCRTLGQEGQRLHKEKQGAHALDKAGAPDSTGTGVPAKRGGRSIPLGPATGTSSSTAIGGGVSARVTFCALGRPTRRGTAFPLFATFFPRVAGGGGGTTETACRRRAGTCSGRHFRIGKSEVKRELTVHDHLLTHLVVAHAAATHLIGQARTSVPELGTPLADRDAPCQMALSRGVSEN